MRNLLFVVTGLLVALTVAPSVSFAQKKKQKEPAAESDTAAAPKGAANACGCYQEPDGTCKCAKKSKCGCPGECEPAGCEEKRQKAFEKEQQDEIKKQKDTQGKHDADLKKRQEEQEAKEEEAKAGKKK